MDEIRRHKTIFFFRVLNPIGRLQNFGIVNKNFHHTYKIYQAFVNELDRNRSDSKFVNIVKLFKEN